MVKVEKEIRFRELNYSYRLSLPTHTHTHTHRVDSLCACVLLRDSVVVAGSGERPCIGTTVPAFESMERRGVLVLKTPAV